MDGGALHSWRNHLQTGRSWQGRRGQWGAGQPWTPPCSLPGAQPLRPLGVKGPRGHHVLMGGQSPVLDIMGVRCPTSLPSRVPETLAYSAKEDDTGKNSKIQAGQMANTWSLGCQVPTACLLTDCGSYSMAMLSSGPGSPLAFPSPCPPITGLPENSQPERQEPRVLQTKDSMVAWLTSRTCMSANCLRRLK